MPINLDSFKARADKAHKEIGAIAAEGVQRWRMSIPAQPDRDSDLIIADVLKDVPSVAFELECARDFIAYLRTSTDGKYASLFASYDGAVGGIPNG